MLSSATLPCLVRPRLGQVDSPYSGATLSLVWVRGRLDLAGVKGRGYTTHGPGPNPSVQTRLDALERNIGAIHDRITQTQAEVDEGLKKAQDAIKNEEQVRSQDDNAIREKLEATGTGGVHISAIGAAWLFVGVTLSTASVEIARCIQ